ncbi:hypothetical protein C1H46_044494 [Malus baccata]|uniref:Uncharacterized protein n=1 Tax=Malus baccata TaxID=106549 RepID=A0A540K6W5_MALBA|nr:hypothetical protein C1H46_044494 [Malus baccata]
MQEVAFWSLLEQNGAWNDYHMLGAQGMDVIEDLKKLGFLINEGFLIEDGFLFTRGFLEEQGFLLQEGFLLEIGKLSQGFLLWFDLS